ncbi:MAG TPA: hypothetical protein VHR45_10965 [Thermoanaerobaculia bacterium]|nr:hypothetical protein [Thermoanaerobaculia bacterium]
MKTKTLIATATLLGLLALAYSAQSSRHACPGKVVCPLTGQTICADQCPLHK